jgi:2-methylisocitrate lyase-like PEP mutase family enzyme
MTTQNDKAQALRALHNTGIFVIPNAWDAGSARLIELAGAQVVATTSAGVAWGLARGDGEHLTRDENVSIIKRIAESVTIPVSADIEGGYGPDPASVEATVHDVAEAGAVGINLEDSNSATGDLFTINEQIARIRAAREGASRAGVPDLLINARTDVYLFQIGAPEGRFDDTITRAKAYADAGANSLFVPGQLDLDVLRKLADASPLPINAMAGPGAPSVSELEGAGVRRVSVGSAIAEAAYGAVLGGTRQLLNDGTFNAFQTPISWGEINGAFTGN